MLKEIVRQVTPPFIFSFARFLYSRLNVHRSIYEGVFATTGDLPALSENPFEHPNWVSYVTERAKSRVGGVVAQDMHEMPLSLIASISMPERQNGLVVDFGGGVGMYWPVMKSQGGARAVASFVVVDSPRNCEAGRRLFGADGVEFYSDFGQVLALGVPIRVLNVSSTLQYCLDYSATVDMLCRSNAEFIVISRHPAPVDVQAPAFTVQNVNSVYGFCGKIAVVLLSVQMLSELMAKHGYTLIADYFSDLDSGKYWKNATQNVPAGLSRIIEHALVYQRFQETPDRSCRQ